MSLRYFGIGVLGLLTLICVYANKPIVASLVAAQAQMLDGLAKKFPSMGAFHWTAMSVSRTVIGVLLYVIAVLSLVGAIVLWQLPPPEVHH